MFVRHVETGGLGQFGELLEHVGPGRQTAEGAAHGQLTQLLVGPGGVPALAHQVGDVVLDVLDRQGSGKSELQEHRAAPCGIDDRGLTLGRAGPAEHQRTLSVAVSGDERPADLFPEGGEVVARKGGEIPW